MRTKPLNRRALLRGVLASGVAAAIPLPLLEAMLNGNGTALAQTNEPLSPLFVSWFFGNGTLPGRWKPTSTGQGAAWALSPLLQPLADYKSYITVASGLENKLVGAGAEHPTGSAGATTGAGTNGNAVRAASIDQVVADAISTGARFRSLELGVTPATPNGNADSLHTVAHKGPSARLNPDFDPKSVFKRLFVDGAAPPADQGNPDQTAKLTNVKKSVLDSVAQDCVSLGNRLGAADKHRVDEHLNAIRAIETRLQTGSSGVTPAACKNPTAPTVGKDAKSEAPPSVNTAMVELTALALACEQTRVLSFMFSLPAAHVYYRHLAADMDDDFHDTVCHGDAGDPSSQPRVEKGVLYTMKCLNELLTKLKGTAHGASNLLDSSLIYVTSDTAWGKIHTKTEWPVLFIGKAGGRLVPDQHLNFPNDNLSKALLTVAQLMGVKKTELGLGAGQVTAALPGIQA